MWHMVKNKETNEEDLTFVESTEDGEELSKKNPSKKLREELKICRQEKENYLTGWQRAKADYINLQKELDLIKINSTVHVKEKMVKDLLPVLDSFDMAFANKKAWQSVDENWRRGIEYIYQQFITSLAKSGIKKIDEINIPFDPQVHHSLKMIVTNKKDKDHAIAGIVQVGYKIEDNTKSTEEIRVIRPAQVNVYEYKDKK